MPVHSPRLATLVVVLSIPACGGGDGNASGTADGSGDTTGETASTTGGTTSSATTADASSGGEPTDTSTAGVDGSSTDGSGATDASSDDGGSDSSGGEASVCGDGIVEGIEVCDGARGCLDDCTYPHNTIFWELEVDGVQPGDGARVWAVGFDHDDRPVYGGDQYGSGGGSFAAIREPDGTLVWSQRSQTTAVADFSYGLTVTADRVVLASQMVAGMGNGNDVLAITFTLDGVPDWRWTNPNPANEWFGAVAAYDDGSVVLAGASNQSVDLDDRGLLTRLDAQGALQWTVEDVGLPGAENGFSDVVVDGDGRAIVLGCCDADTGSAILAAFDPDGTPVWRTALDVVGAGFFLGSGLTRDPEGRFVVAATDDNGDPWLVITDADGNVVASQAIVGADGVNPNSIAATPQGTYVVAGSHSLGGLGAELWYGVLDHDGALLSSDAVAATGGGSFARANAVAVDAHGLALIGGERCTAAGPSCGLRGYVRMLAP